MKMHYKVRSVLLSHDSSALTLSPVEWGKDSETETETDETTGDTFPAWEPCDPQLGAEAVEIGGKMTELRVDGPTYYKPGEYLTVTVEPSLS